MTTIGRGPTRIGSGPGLLGPDRSKGQCSIQAEACDLVRRKCEI
jgi:hypothetical protein